MQHCEKANPTSMSITTTGSTEGKIFACSNSTSDECLDSPSVSPLSFYNETTYQSSPLQISKQLYSKNANDYGCDHVTKHFTVGKDSEVCTFHPQPQTMSNVTHIRPHPIVSSSNALPPFENMCVSQTNGLQFARCDVKQSYFVPHSEFYQPVITYHNAMKAPILNQNVPQIKKYDAPNQSYLQGNGKPLATMSAYNFFFRHERERIIAGNDDHDGDYSFARKEALLCDHWFRDRSKKRSHRKSHGKVSFASLSRTVAQRWKELPEHRKQFYQDLADEDLRRYRHELIHRELGSNAPHISSLKMCPEAQVQDIVFKASNFFDLTPIPSISEGCDR